MVTRIVDHIIEKLGALRLLLEDGNTVDIQLIPVRVTDTGEKTPDDRHSTARRADRRQKSDQGGQQMKKIGALIVVALLLACCAGDRVRAQQAVLTQPYTGVVTTNASSTVAVTNTFQSVFVGVGQAATATTPQANQRRNACTIQNTGTNPMYVYFGALADATIAKSIKLTAGNAATCNNNGITVQEQVSITGTATETFYAAQQ